MMTTMNKCYIEIIYRRFIDFGLKTYYLDSHKCYDDGISVFIVFIKSYVDQLLVKSTMQNQG